MVIKDEFKRFSSCLSHDSAQQVEITVIKLLDESNYRLISYSSRRLFRRAFQMRCMRLHNVETCSEMRRARSDSDLYHNWRFWTSQQDTQTFLRPSVRILLIKIRFGQALLIRFHFGIVGMRSPRVDWFGG